MSVEIAEQVGDLKKYQASRPYAGPAAEPWKDDFRQYGLYLKKEKGAQEDRAAPDGQSARLRTKVRSLGFRNDGGICNPGIHVLRRDKPALPMKDLHVTSAKANQERQP